MSQNNQEQEELYVVTEQGVFGDLEVNDPSKKKAKTKEEIDKEIKEAIERNSRL